VATLVNGIGTSDSTLLRTFKRNLHKTTEEYIRIRKLQEAKFLIRSKQHNISETAFILGYNSQSAFTTAFRKHFSILPSSLVE